MTLGSGFGSHSMIRGTHGTLHSPGGEGSPQWWFTPETKSAWRDECGLRSARGESQDGARHHTGPHRAAPVKQDDNLKAHTDNWFQCMRNRKTPNGSIESGFAQP